MQIYAESPMGTFEGYGEVPELKPFESWSQLLGWVELEGYIYYREADAGATVHRRLEALRCNTCVVLNDGLDDILTVGEDELDNCRWAEAD